MKLQAVILTGSRALHNPLLAGSGLQSKALLPVGGYPMLRWVLHAVAGSRHRPSLYVSSNDPAVLALQKDCPFEPLPSEDQAVHSMLRSLERLPGEGWVLFVSGDHALLTAEMVDTFVDAVVERGLTFGVALVERGLVDAAYPESRRTYFAARNGAYSGGNLFLINKAAFRGRTAFMETIDRNRKAPWKSMFMLDPLTITQILLRRLDMHEIARRASRVFDCEVGVIEMPFAECCMDVDKPSDWTLADAILSERSQSSAVPAARLMQPIPSRILPEGA